MQNKQLLKADLFLAVGRRSDATGFVFAVTVNEPDCLLHESVKLSDHDLVVDKDGEKNNGKSLIYGNTDSTLYIVMVFHLTGKFSYEIHRSGLG